MRERACAMRKRNGRRADANSLAMSMAHPMFTAAFVLTAATAACVAMSEQRHLLAERTGIPWREAEPALELPRTLRRMTGEVVVHVAVDGHALQRERP